MIVKWPLFVERTHTFSSHFDLPGYIRLGSQVLVKLVDLGSNAYQHPLELSLLVLGKLARMESL
jgi:hypothetical protein